MADHSHADHQDGHHGVHHIQPLDIYLKVFGSLLVLTVITVWIAQFNFGVLTGFIAMFVATIKASLVGMYFMNLRQDNKLYTVILISAVAFLFLLFAFTVFDFDTRVLEESTL